MVYILLQVSFRRNKMPYGFHKIVFDICSVDLIISLFFINSNMFCHLKMEIGIIDLFSIAWQNNNGVMLPICKSNLNWVQRYHVLNLVRRLNDRRPSLRSSDGLREGHLIDLLKISIHICQGCNTSQ